MDSSLDVDTPHFGTKHAAGDAGVQRMESDADLLAEDLVADAGRPVAVLRQAVEDLGVEQQRAAPELVLDEQHGLGLDLGQLLHGLEEEEAEVLGGPARHAPEVAKLVEVATEGHVRPREFSEALLQGLAFALLQEPGPVGRLHRRAYQRQALAAGHAVERVAVTR